jgi:hypothetical protein
MGMFKRCLMVIVLIVLLGSGITPAKAEVDFDDSVTHAWHIVDEHGVQHGVRTVWHEGKIKITKRDFANGNFFFAVRWKGRVVLRYWSNIGIMPTPIHGEWQEILLRVWCEDYPMRGECA